MKKGDIVKLNRAGIDFMNTGRFPAIVGSMYSNVYEGGGKILKIEGDTVRIRILNGGYPASMDVVNDFGIQKGHLMVVN
jgi:hypothetical protein